MDYWFLNLNYAVVMEFSLKSHKMHFRWVAWHLLLSTNLPYVHQWSPISGPWARSGCRYRPIRFNLLREEFLYFKSDDFLAWCWFFCYVFTPDLVCQFHFSNSGSKLSSTIKNWALYCQHLTLAKVVYFGPEVKKVGDPWRTKSKARWPT